MTKTLRFLAGLALGVSMCVALPLAIANVSGLGLPNNPIGSSPAVGNLDMAGYDIENADDWWWDAKSTDAAPNVSVFSSQPVVVTPGATNVTGANLVLGGSPGAQNLTGVTRAGTAGDTLTFNVTTNGVVTSTVKTAGTDWVCAAAATDIICVCNLYTALTVTAPITGVTVTRTNGTCSDEKLSFSITPGAAEDLAVVSSDTTNIVVVSSKDGGIVLNTSLAYKTGTILADDTTPSVTGADLWVTSANSGATAITDLDDVLVGSQVTLCGGSATNSSTIADAGNFALNSAMTLGLDQCISLWVQADNDYIEMGRGTAGGADSLTGANADTISNAVDSQWKLACVGDTNNEDLIVDCDATANTITLTTSTGVTTLDNTAIGNFKTKQVGYPAFPSITCTGANPTCNVDWTASQIQLLDMDAATGCTVTVTMTAPTHLARMVLFVKQAAVACAITWPATVLWPSDVAPTLTATNNAVDAIECIWDSTSYNCTWANDFR